LYPKYRTEETINYGNYTNYTDKIRNHLRSSNGKYKDGDILFIGTHKSRQEYGFATVISNGTNFKSGEEPIMNTPGVYYKQAMKEINEFWENFDGYTYFGDDWIEDVKQSGHYNKPIANKDNSNSNNSMARKIQTAFRKSRLSNEGYLKLHNKRTGLTNAQSTKMQSFVNRTGKNYKSVISSRSKNTKAVPAVTKIQSVFRGYASRDIEPRKQFLSSLSKDGRFDYYVQVLAKLEHKVDTVLHAVRDQNKKDPLSAITGIIDVCHYKPNPHKTVANVTNVRKNLTLLKKKTPREYLQTFRKQFSYVAKQYAKMDDKNRKGYRDRLSSELSSRPCLENLLDSLAKALLKQEFVWLGKSKNYQNDPLKPNNVRYLGYGPKLGMKKGLVNTAIQTWKNSGNRPINWNTKNENSRKDMFWKMIKNLPLSMVHSGNVVNGTLSLYNNENGKKFKSSKLANTLQYI